MPTKLSDSLNPKLEPHNARRINGLLPGGLAQSEIERLYKQLGHTSRDLVIAAGNWSLWALSNCTGSETIRESNGQPVPTNIQTYTPTGILNWRGSMLFCEGHEEFGPLPPLTPPPHRPSRRDP